MHTDQCSCSDLDTLRTQNQNAQNESATAVSQASAVLSMNMKLQSTLSKSQARNIDWELHKIEAAESKELLAIVQVGAIYYYLSRILNGFVAVSTGAICRYGHKCY